MLSRIADAILWMSRYVERAEHAARVVDVNLNLMLDLGLHGTSQSAHFWGGLLSVAEDRELFHRLYGGDVNERTVSEFLTFAVDNPNSIVRTISRARENARTIRESISTEMWEHLNRTYWQVRGERARQHWLSEPHSFYQQMKEASQAFQGITDATMLRGEEWHFLQLGKYLERADNTSRILAIKYHSLRDAGAWDESVNNAQWTAMLKSCSGFEAYRRHYVSRVEQRRVAEFLIFSGVFPRSIRFSVCAAADALHDIGGGISSAEAKLAERLLGQLRSYLDYGTIEEVESIGPPDYLDDLQRRLNRVTKELYAAYLIYEPVFPQGRPAAAQQEQQQ